jgi:hypothetical protein
MKLGLGISIVRQRMLGSGFLPSDISNLDLWYDFSTISGSNGDAQASFANAGLGGSDYDLAQTNSAIRPTLDTSELELNSLDFDDDRFGKRLFDNR